jgi:hypothetical protein
MPVTVFILGLFMQPACSFETLVSTLKYTWFYNPEDKHQHFMKCVLPVLKLFGMNHLFMRVKI